MFFFFIGISMFINLIPLESDTQTTNLNCSWIIYVIMYTVKTLLYLKLCKKHYSGVITFTTRRSHHIHHSPESSHSPLAGVITFTTRRSHHIHHTPESTHSPLAGVITFTTRRSRHFHHSPESSFSSLV